MARRKRSETVTESSTEIKAKGKFSRAKKCVYQGFGVGKHNNETEEKSPSNCLDESPSSQVEKSINTKDGAQEVPVLDLHSERGVPLSGKMKLQLFPLDAHTRKGLEKDGFHPYLELTLSSRKKVSSVLQHIHSKWGSSEIARGDPTLYPYDNWTANSNITARDIYVAIGAPSLFRLRYGWSCDIDNKTDKPPSLSTPDNPLSSSNQVTDLSPSENKPPDGQIDSAENKINNGSGSTFFSWDDGLTSLSIGGLLSEASLKGNFGNHSKNSNAENANATLWDDSLTNISIGGLFSEASLQDRRGINREQESARNNNNDQPSVSLGGLLSEASSLEEGKFRDGSKTWETRRAILQQSVPQPPCPTPPLPPPELSHSSILDAEDTCHAFSFRKRTTTTPKFLDQVSEETEKEQQKKDEPKTAKGLFGSMVFSQDSSLGFSGIEWAESRGPFDFGLSSSSRKFINGDSISFGAVVKDLQKMESSEPEDKIKLQKH